ncbi:hypothetical protein BH23PLA1_BH23PLA1_18520 [soil metagenome]
MTTTVLLIMAGILSRLIPHPDNMVPLGAIALYAAARLPRQWAIVVPLAVLLLSDVIIDMGHGYPFHFTPRLTTYAAFTLIVAFGWLAPKNAGMFTRFGMAISASTLFFLLSNFAVWVSGGGYAYAMTFGGLASTYAVALPFYHNSLIADVLGTGVLFGLDALLRREPQPLPAVAVAVAVAAEADPNRP